MERDEVVEILGDLKISIVNHAIGLDDVERKRASDRVDAINYCLALCGKAIPNVGLRVSDGMGHTGACPDGCQCDVSKMSHKSEKAEPKYYGDRSCPECNGKGIYLAEQPDHYIPCVKCNGTGKSESDVAEIINREPLPEEGKKWEWAKRLAKLISESEVEKVPAHTFGVCKKCGYSLISKEHIPCTIGNITIEKDMERWIRDWSIYHNGGFDPERLAHYICERIKI